MLLQIPDVLTADQVAHARARLQTAEWVAGRVTAGHLPGRGTDDMQVPGAHPVSRELGEMVLAALQRNALFVSAALPLRVLPPLFNRRAGGMASGNGVEHAIREGPGGVLRIRTDLSATLFLADPDEYEGGELVVEDTYGVHSVKLAPGHMVLYPSTSLHHVRSVTAGARLASSLWIQSMVREDGERTLLFDLDTAIQRLTLDLPDHPAAAQLAVVYHNLLRRWADV